MPLVKPFGFLAGAAAGPGYGTPPWNSNVLFYYNFGEQTSWDSGSATITDVEGNTNAELIGGDWTYDDGTNINMGVGSAYQSTKGPTNGKGILPANNIGGPYNGFAAEYFFKTPSTDWTDDNILARMTKGSFTDSYFEVAIQQYAITPPKRIYYEGSSETTSGGAIFYSIDFTIDTWYHLVFSMEQSGNTKLYVNGSHVGTGPNTFGASDTWEWTINTDANRRILGYNFASNWTGYMGAIRWYGEKATDANVLANYNHFANYVTF